MFGLGFGEIMVIAILALVVVGPSRLPTLMKTVGGAMRQLRQASRDIRTSVGFDELIDLDGPKPNRPVTTRVRPPVDSAAVASGTDAPPVAPVAHAAPNTAAEPASEAQDASAQPDKVPTANS